MRSGADPQDAGKGSSSATQRGCCWKKSSISRFRAASWSFRDLTFAEYSDECAARGGSQAVFFHLDHLQQLPPPGHEMFEFLLLGSSGKGRVGAASDGHKSQDLSVQAVGLGGDAGERAKLRTSLG